MTFRILPQEPSQESSKPSSNVQGKFRLIPEEPPTKFEEAKRHVARTGSRIAETLAGLPGDIIQAPAKLTKYGIEKFTGKQHPELDEALKSARSMMLGGSLPTSSELREKAKELSEGYLEPKTKNEELSDSIISDFASLAIPVKGKIPFLRSLGIALGSNLASEGAELLGAGEGAKIATKLGTTFLMTAFNPKGASKFGDTLYSEAKEMIPKGASINAQNLSKEIGMLETQLAKGGSAPYKSGAQTKLKEIRGKIKNGRIPVEELTEFKIDLNKARSGLYADQSLDKGGKALAKRNLDSASKVVDNALKEYGHANPEWAKKYRAANEVYGTIAQSKKAGNAIARVVKANPHSSGALLAGELFFAPKTLPAAAGAIGAWKAGELMVRISKSSTLRKYYMGVVEGALKEDSALILKNLNKLDAGLKKEQQPIPK